MAGHVTVNSTISVQHTEAAGEVHCVLVESTDIPPDAIAIFDESAHKFEAAVGFKRGSLSATRTFEIAAGASVDFVLACDEFKDGGLAYARNLTAIFTPAP